MNLGNITAGAKSAAAAAGQKPNTQSGAQPANSGNAANAAAIATMQVQLQAHEARIKRLEAMVAHQSSTIAALQSGRGALPQVPNVW